MIHFTQFQTFPKIPENGQKFQPRDKVPKSESTAEHSASVKQRKYSARSSCLRRVIVQQMPLCVGQVSTHPNLFMVSASYTGMFLHTPCFLWLLTQAQNDFGCF